MVEIGDSGYVQLKSIPQRRPTGSRCSGPIQTSTSSSLIVPSGLTLLSVPRAVTKLAPSPSVVVDILLVLFRANICLDRSDMFAWGEDASRVAYGGSVCSEKAEDEEVVGRCAGAGGSKRLARGSVRFLILYEWLVNTESEMMCPNGPG